jgi:hypothetical protein
MLLHTCVRMWVVCCHRELSLRVTAARRSADYGSMLPCISARITAVCCRAEVCGLRQYAAPHKWADYGSILLRISERYGSMLSHLSAHKRRAVMNLVVMSSKPSRDYGKGIISFTQACRTSVAHVYIQVSFLFPVFEFGFITGK